MKTTIGTHKVPDNLNIPTLPTIVSRINRLIDDSTTGTREIGRVLAEDAPLAARVLRIANSVYYGLEQPCVSAEQACTVLGVRALRDAVAQVAVIHQFDHLRETGFDLDGLWKHAILTAQACSRLAGRSTVFGLTPSEFYSCGLLHDVGRVVMLDKFGTRYVDILRDAESAGVKSYIAEAQEFGYDHTDIGAIVAQRWGLPGPIANAIQFHHGPREAVQGDAVVTLVAATDLLVHRIEEGDLAKAAEIFDSQTARRLGLTAESLAESIAYFVEHHSLIEV